MIKQLTPRQRAVLDCASRGLCLKGTARELGISAVTVKVYRREVRMKIGAEGWRMAVYRNAGAAR